mmetsp:Transcript_5221/g.12977  ORF Transcript_5221/g.12977 Transcript_5221/m.12977 type:complete len:232 (+) Transcript_5221:774-1469(+)
MATDDGHLNVLRMLPSDVRHELVRTHAVQRRHANDLHRVEALLLVEVSHRGDDGVDGVHNEGDHRLRAVLRAGLDQALGDVRVDLEEVVPRHAWLAGHARRNEHQAATREGLPQVVARRLADLHDVALHRTFAFDVREVRRDARGRHHGDVEVEDGHLAHVGIHGHEHAERLPDAAGASTDADLELAAAHDGLPHALATHGVSHGARPASVARPKGSAAGDSQNWLERPRP